MPILQKRKLRLREMSRFSKMMQLGSGRARIWTHAVRFPSPVFLAITLQIKHKPNYKNTAFKLPHKLNVTEDDVLRE